jgi:hypothetical protein
MLERRKYISFRVTGENGRQGKLMEHGNAILLLLLALGVSTWWDGQQWNGRRRQAVGAGHPGVGRLHRLHGQQQRGPHTQQGWLLQPYGMDLNGGKFLTLNMFAEYREKIVEIVGRRRDCPENHSREHVIDMIHYNYLTVIYLTYNIFNSSSNQHMTHQQLNSFTIYYLSHHHS